MPKTPTVTYGDSYSIGQLAQMWERPPSFVRLKIGEGKLQVNERGLVPNDALRTFDRDYGIELDA
jgi:hypothetical protein